MSTEEMLILYWSVAENQKITDGNIGEVLIKDGHVCKACVTPKTFNSLKDLLSHIKEYHSIESLKDYCITWNIKPCHTFSYKHSVRWQHQRIRPLREKKSKKSKVVTTEGIKKVWTRLWEGGEIAKSIRINGVEAYQRLPIVKSKKSKSSVGGLVPADMMHIPKTEENFILDESFHKDTIKALVTSGFNSILLTGDTGIGKTCSVKQIASLMRQPILRENITGSTKVEHLLQQEMIDEKKKTIYYEDKSLPICAEKGYWLLIDEISAGTPQVMFMFFRVLEEGEIKLFDGRTIQPHPNFKIIFTDNRIGNPNYFRYHGTNQQNLAFINRISTTIYYSHLSPDNERRILQKKFGVEKDFASKLVEFAGLVRKESEEGNYPDFLSTRDLEHITKNFLVFGNAKDAFASGYLNKVQEAEQKVFAQDLWKRVFGTANSTPQLT